MKLRRILQLMEEMTTEMDFTNYTTTEVTTAEAVAEVKFAPWTLPIDWSVARALRFMLSVCLITVCLIGNTLIMIAIITEKKLHTPFSYYLFNLAVTDFCVGLFVAGFFCFYNLYDVFPFAGWVCDFYVWIDYWVTFESVVTLAAISMDRFWSVTWTIHYRQNNSSRKCVYILIATWVYVSVFWFPAFAYDRINAHYEPGTCWYDPAQNKWFVVVLEIFGYLLPLALIMISFGRVMTVMLGRSKTMAAMKAKTNQVTTINVEDTEESKEAKEKKELERKKERIAFLTLSSVLAVFLFSWLPFYIVFPVSAFDEDFFSSGVVIYSYWAAYLNSAANPVIYTFSNSDFRRAFKNILTCSKS